MKLGLPHGERYYLTTPPAHNSYMEFLMTSKERVRAAVAGEPVDKIPLGFYIVDCDTVEAVIGRKTYVRDKIGQRIALWEGRRDEVVESCKKDTVEFFEKIGHCDLITHKEAGVWPAKDYDPGEPPKKREDGRWEDKQGRIYQASELSNEILCVYDQHRTDVDDFSEDMFPVPSEDEIEPPDPSIFEAFDYVIDKLGKDRYIAGLSGGLTAFTHVGDRETALMMYALKPGVVVAKSRAQVARQKVLDRWHIRPGQDGVLFEQDMAGTTGPLISPNQFREYGYPFMAERVADVKSHDMQVLLHNCGDNRPLMSMFVDAGIDCYQSLQTNAGMSVQYLSETWGDRMTFWGGIAVESLVEGTPDDVRNDVRNAIEAGKKGRGFILGASHSIAYGTKYENFMALLDEYDAVTANPSMV